MSADALQCLARQTFGHTQLRDDQARVAATLLQGRDSLVLWPTGAGKSLCYQLAAVTLRARGAGTTLCVSPLIALMDDQVRALQARGVAAAALHSAHDALQGHAAWGDFVSGRLDILYLSPERLVSAGFLRATKHLSIAALVIDEAHCISAWGHDFRPEYRRLGDVRRHLAVPAMALTATATPKVAGDIVKLLGLKAPAHFRKPMRRDNLALSVELFAPKASRAARLLELAEAAPARGKILYYCSTRKAVEKSCEALSAAGHNAVMYHAGRTQPRRRAAIKAFNAGRARYMVATNAFGMGVDLPDIRQVIHVQAPASLEAYYQEAGRAGRDGEPAQCILLFANADSVVHRQLSQAGGAQRRQSQADQLAAMAAYATSPKCRAQTLQTYFGETVAPACGICDVCCDAAPIRAAQQRFAAPARPQAVAPDALILQTIESCVATLRRPCGRRLIAATLRGSRAKSLKHFGLLQSPQHGALKERSEATILAGIEALLKDGRLRPLGNKYPTVWLASRPVRDPARAAPQAKRRSTQGSDLARALQRFCRNEARRLGWKPYMVLTRQVMKQIETVRPETSYALEALHGMGERKVERFGKALLALVSQYP